MRHSFTAVVSKNERLTAGFETEPYEAPWASELRVFVNALELVGDNARWELQLQVSPDGLCWCDHESDPIEVHSPGVLSIGVGNFGQWLRIKGTPKSHDTMLRSIIYLALKE